MKLFRPSGIIIFLVLTALLWGVTYLWINGWLAEAVEEHGTQANGATVEAQSVSINWLTSGLNISQLALANPENLSQNRLQLDQLNFDLSLTSLLKGQLHVDELTIENLRVNVPRQSPAQLAAKSEGDNSSWQWPKAVMDQTKELNTKDVLASVDIQSPQAYEKFLADIKQQKHQWQQAQQALPDDAKIEQLKQQYQTAKKQLDDAKGLEKLSATKDLKEVLNQIKQEKQKIAQFRREVSEGIKDTRSQWERLKAQVDKDVDLAMSMASLSPEGMRHLAASLLGESTAHWIELVVDNLDKVRGLPTSPKQKDEQAPLRRGIDVALIQPQLPPDFWIKKARLSGAFQMQQQQGNVSGDIINLANALLPNQPTKGNVKLSLGESSSAGTGELQFALQHPDDAKDLISGNFQLKQWPIREWALAEGALSLTDALADINLSLGADKSRAKLMLSMQLTDFKVNNANSSASKWVAQLTEILKDSPKVTLDIGFEQQGEQHKLTFSSNLDTLFFARIKAEFQQRADKVKANVKEELQQRLQPMRQNIEQQLGALVDFEQLLGNRIGDLEQLK